jgi:hypothetical protein
MPMLGENRKLGEMKALEATSQFECHEQSRLFFLARLNTSSSTQTVAPWSGEEDAPWAMACAALIKLCAKQLSSFFLD